MIKENGDDDNEEKEDEDGYEDENASGHEDSDQNDIDIKKIIKKRKTDTR